MMFWFGSCVSDQNVFVADISEPDWSSKVQISYPNSDTLEQKDIHLLVRYNPQYMSDYLALELRISDPCGRYIIDSIVMDIESKGSYLGESKMLYRSDNLFKSLGDYTFTFSPLAASVNQKGIVAVGVIID